MPDSDAGEALQHFVDFLQTSDLGPSLSYEDVSQCTTRAELGISSLTILLLIANYIDANTGGAITLQPEWVPRLDEVEGILSVIAEIDRSSLLESPA
ncbi:MAG TPA: hypothetical protein VGS19_34385 [Streptosporangiaceae bacterium]|nr:hypothetical protein [Streptosporangiaceae bacterium]